MGNNNIFPPDIMGRIPPHAIELEEGVLGAVMLERSAMDRVYTLLTEQHFYSPSHQLIWKSAIELYQANQPIDLLSVNESLRASNNLDMVGGTYALAQIANRVTSTANIEFHARILNDRKLLRDCIGFAGKVAEMGYKIDSDPYLILSDIQKFIDERLLTHESDGEKLQILMQKQIESLKIRMYSDKKVLGHTTGWRLLDNYTGGYCPGEFWVVAGRPGMGKTAFALSAALEHARTGGRVLMFSVEMASSQLADRALSVLSGVENMGIRNAILTEGDLSRIERECAVDPNIIIIDNPALKIEQMRAKVKGFKQTQDTTLVILDYLQLVKSIDKKVREQEIAHISRTCKTMSREFGVTVMALAQLNRENDGSIPKLSNLRESGSIEQDADIVLFPYREWYYKSLQGEQAPVPEPANLIIAKSRNGGTGSLDLQFNPQTTQYIW